MTLDLLWEVRYSVWICRDKIFASGLSCLHVFQNLPSVNRLETKTKKTMSCKHSLLQFHSTQAETWLPFRCKSDLKKNETEKKENEENEEKEPQLQVQPGRPTAAFWLATNVEQAAKPPLHWLSLASNLSQMFKFPRFNPLTSASRRATCTRASPFSLNPWHIFF